MSLPLEVDALPQAASLVLEYLSEWPETLFRDFDQEPERNACRELRQAVERAVETLVEHDRHDDAQALIERLDALDGDDGFEEDNEDCSEDSEDDDKPRRPAHLIDAASGPAAALFDLEGDSDEWEATA